MELYLNDVIDIIQSKLNVSITGGTILNYEKWGLIETPERGSGRSTGRWNKHPRENIYSIYAAWCLMHGKYTDEAGKMFGSMRISPETVKRIRAKANQSNGFLMSETRGEEFLVAYVQIYNSLLIKAKRILGS